MGIDEIMTGIVHDALRYPLSNWRRFLVLGIIMCCAAIAGIADYVLGIKDLAFLGRLIIIGFLIGFLALGYLFKIMRSSFAGSAELPKFNSLPDLYMDGIKFFIVYVVYIMPVIFIAPIEVVSGGIWIVFEIVYTAMIIPLFLMSLTSMISSDTFGAAFKFIEIFNKMGDKGWLNIINWYIATGIPLLGIFFIGEIMSMIAMLISPLGQLLLYLIINPYLGMYFFRSAGLFYKPEKTSEVENPEDTIYSQKYSENLNEADKVIERRKKLSELKKTINKILAVVLATTIMLSAICTIVFSILGI
jgi:hypothetical protein